MHLYKALQIKEWDRYTIENEPVESLDLMKRAAQKFTDLFVRYCDISRPVQIYCGSGNNGGDGLVVARLLRAAGYHVAVVLCDFGKASQDMEQLLKYRITGDIPVLHLYAGEPFPAFEAGTVMIDALFGTGLNKELRDFPAAVVKHLNDSGAEIVSIDLPSGMFADRHTEGVTIRANKTITFETPKLAFFFPENGDRVGEWEMASIGLHPGFLLDHPSDTHFLQAGMIRPLLRKRRRFDHKGLYGHSLLIAGSLGKAGAAVLAARGCLAGGTGLLTVHVPAGAVGILQTTVPEAMVSPDAAMDVVTALPDLTAFEAIGLGCGLGQAAPTILMLEHLTSVANVPLVWDADALNGLASNQSLLSQLPLHSILTPHPGEFKRLFGPTANDFERWELQLEKSRELDVIIVLKGAYTCITTPSGQTYFNATGNPGMATGGSGDVLTGLITGLLAQGLIPLHAAIAGVYLHGMAGDMAAREKSMEAMTAGDIAGNIGRAFLEIRK